jgi:hypothetical protein
MSTLFKLLLVLHFIGLASLLGGFLVQLSAERKVVNHAMLGGAFLQLITGLALDGVLESKKVADETVPGHTFVAVKLIVLVVVLALCWVDRKKESISPAVYWAIGGLTTLNVFVGVFGQ